MASPPRYVLDTGRQESVDQLRNTQGLMQTLTYLIINSITPRMESNWLSGFDFSSLAAVYSLVLVGLPYRSDQGIDTDKLSFLESLRGGTPSVKNFSYEEVVGQSHASPFSSAFRPWETLESISLTVMRCTWLFDKVSTPH